VIAGRWDEEAAPCSACGRTTWRELDEHGERVCDRCAASREPRCFDCGAPCWSLAWPRAREHVLCAECWRARDCEPRILCEICGAAPAELVFTDAIKRACTACRDRRTARALVERVKLYPYLRFFFEMPEQRP
jgi:hypothetical protein